MDQHICVHGGTPSPHASHLLRTPPHVLCAHQEAACLRGLPAGCCHSYGPRREAWRMRGQGPWDPGAPSHQKEASVGVPGAVVHKDSGLPALRISGNWLPEPPGWWPRTHAPCGRVPPPTLLLGSASQPHCSGTQRSESGSRGSDGRGRSMPVVIYGNLCWKHSNLK